MHNYKEAFFYLEKSIDLLTLIGDKINLASSYDELAKVYTNCSADLLKEKNIRPADRYSVVLDYQNKSLSISKEIGAIEKEESAWADISDTYKAQGNHVKALEAYKQSIVCKDSMINDAKKQQVTRLEMQYQFDKKQDSITAVNDKKEALAGVQIRQQQTLRNATIAGAIVLLASGLFVFMAYKKRRDAKAKQHELELQAQITDTEMKALRAQMNPHFIFNSLNSINDYIDKSEAQTAMNFTTKFAKLMRRILENSEHKEITLDNELQTLELYLQLEAMRLQHKFSYEIKVDENIDTENTLIPPLLLQPFLENSIRHGLTSMQDGGKITVLIQKEDEMLNCVVEDNGRGLKTGMQINGNEQEERKSFGIKITRARIDIINQLENANGKVELYNLTKGTRAKVTLPLKTAF